MMQLRIKEVCKEKGITFNKLCEKIGITRQSLSKSLTNNPTSERITEVANALNCEEHELIKTSENFSHFYDNQTKEWLGIRKK